MQFLDGKLLLSASDLVNFLGCKHATYLDLGDLKKPVKLPARDAATVLIFEKGIEHEKRYLASLKARGFAVIEVAGEGFDVPERTALTRETMWVGAEVIYQAALVIPPWLGYADFLERVSEASNLGAWSYEAVDTKLSRRAKPDHVIQLTTYSKLIGNEQGRTPTQMHVQLGSNERVSLRVSDFAHYHSIAQRRLETFANRRTGGFGRGTMWSLSHLSLVGSLRGAVGCSRSPHARRQHHPPSDQAIMGSRDFDRTVACGTASRVKSSRYPSRHPQSTPTSGDAANRQTGHRRQLCRDAPVNSGQGFRPAATSR
jgi:hypothetical protein